MAGYIESTAWMEAENMGMSLTRGERTVAQQLIAEALELEKRFSMTEYAVELLEQTLGNDELPEALTGTYESHAFTHLQFFLFKEVITSLCAGVLDNDRRSVSVRKILRQLRADNGRDKQILREYQSDPCGLTIEIATSSDSTLNETTIAQQRDNYRSRAVTRFDELWDRIESCSCILSGDAARRLTLARNKVIAHFDATETGLHDFASVEGLEGFSWSEPIEFFRLIRGFAYGVYLLITGTEWDSESSKTTRFYAASFWERVRKGTSALEPPVLY
ncbi:MAG: hypothetical protein AAF662_06500 [Pseudomonadota bacterium]